MKPETSKRIKELEADVDALKQIVELTFWQARRYSSGRMTYAPSMVRDAWKIIQMRFKGQLPQSEKYDDVVGRPNDFELSESRKDDLLCDCMNPEKHV